MQNTSWPCATSHSISERVGPRARTYQRLISDGTIRIGVANFGWAGANRISFHLFSVHTTECGVTPTAAGPFGARRSGAAIESTTPRCPGAAVAGRGGGGGGGG